MYGRVECTYVPTISSTPAKPSVYLPFVDFALALVRSVRALSQSFLDREGPTGFRRYTRALCSRCDVLHSLFLSRPAVKHRRCVIVFTRSGTCIMQDRAG